jgi:hypothetical protein
MFAWLKKDTLVLRLPAARVEELVAAGKAKMHRVGGKPMEGYAEVIGTSDATWLDLARESLAHVRDSGS